MWLCIRLNNAGKWACDQLTENADFGKKKIIFSNEAHFDLGGYVNKHLGHRKAARIHWKAYTPKTSHCLVRILVQRHNFAIFLRKCARRGRYSQWLSLSGHVERIFVHKNWKGGYWQHLLSKGRRYVAYSLSYPRCLTTYFWRSHYQPQSWCRWHTSELRFDTVGLLFVGCHQR